MAIFDALGVLALGEIPLDPFLGNTSLTERVPYGPEHPIQLRTWTWSYNLNLRGQDKLPTGEQTTDLTRGQVPPRSLSLQTWTWSYNLNLIGQDRLPTGEQSTALPPRDHDRSIELRTWIKSATALALAPGIPLRQTDWPLTAAPQQPAFGFTQTRNPNLVGQDKLPPGEKLFDLSPKDYERSIDLRTWLNSPTIAPPEIPLRQTDWPLTPAPEQPAYGFTQTYNPNLVGQDKFPPGERVLEAPIGPIYHIQLRSWSWSYNLNLIGEDILPFRQQDWPLPIPPDRQAITFLNAIVYPAVSAKPFNQSDWPLPIPPPPPIIMQNPNPTLFIPIPFVPMMGQIWM